jgi:hypothetical protein
VNNLSVAQASAIFRIPPAHISALLRESRPASNRKPETAAPPDRVLDRIVAEHGVAAVMAALARFTSPRFSCAVAAE